MRALRQGPPAEPGTVDVGALTDPEQLDLVASRVEDAVAKGARVTTGGAANANGKGQFFEPTVLADCDHSMDIMREETFGPTLAVMQVDDAEQAVELANDSSYGLSASVFTRDVARGEQIARRVEAGGVFLNDMLLNGLTFEAQFGGWKSSGMGSRNGAEASASTAARS